MALAPGSRLGAYEVIAAIGQGGMGEVYRARDTRLKRDVALKILPESFAADPERLARFQREAEVLASLNHPHIAAIYGLEESDGARALVMEFVEGPTLADRIAQGPIPVDEALPIARQMAEALEAAHEQGIIHRDLKPANIKLRPDGTVKVLDFGLAKALEPAGAGRDFSPGGSNDQAYTYSPTITSPALMTGAGMLLGTAAYMAPEQVRGSTVDRRADIWAFGCVLYEMLTGRQAFRDSRTGTPDFQNANSVPDILARVLHSEPDLSLLPGTIPDGICVLLRRCLQKDRKRRLRDAGDVQIWLEEALAPPLVAHVAKLPSLWRRWLPWSVAIGAVVASLATWHLRPAPATPLAPSHVAIVLPSGDRLGVETVGLRVAISPDGSQLAYVGTRGGTEQLYLRQLDSDTGRPLPGTEGAGTPFFSPDGQWIGFSAEGKLKKVSVTGGVPVIVSDLAATGGATWGSNDTIVFTPSTTSGLFRVSAAGGTPQPLTMLDRSKGEDSHRYPQFLPGNNVVLFTSLGDERVVAALTVDSGEQRIVVRGGDTGRFVPTGHLVYAQGGTLLAVSFDPVRLEASGAPVTMVEGVARAPFAGAEFSFSLTGSLAYVPAGQRVFDRRLVWVDRQGKGDAVPAPTRAYDNVALSPDGRQLAAWIEADLAPLWIYDLARGTLSRLSPDAGNRPVWTPDGQRIAYQATRAGSRSLFWRAADGTGSEERLTTGENQQDPASWSPDGKLLLFSENSPTTGSDIWTLPMQGTREAKPLLRTPFSERMPVLSPDGRWLAYISNESGRFEVYIQPFPGPGRKWQISTEGGIAPLWNPNGRELFYRSDDKLMAVEIATEPSFAPGPSRVLFEGRYHMSVSNARQYDIAPDGTRFLMIQSVEPEQPATHVNIVLNWTEELKRLVPTGH